MSNDWDNETITTKDVAIPNLGADMDTLFELAVNMDEVRQTQSDALKPAGSYTTIPALSVQKKILDDGPNAGRPVIRFYGPAALTVVERNAKRTGLPVGTVVKGVFGFGISPTRAGKIKDGVRTNEPDLATTLWADAATAFKVAYHREPKVISELVEYVANYPVNIRVIKLEPTDERPDVEPGNLVMGLSAVRDPQ